MCVASLLIYEHAGATWTRQGANPIVLSRASIFAAEGFVATTSTLAESRVPCVTRPMGTMPVDVSFDGSTILVGQSVQQVHQRANAEFEV